MFSYFWGFLNLFLTITSYFTGLKAYELDIYLSYYLISFWININVGKLEEFQSESDYGLKCSPSFRQRMEIQVWLIGGTGTPQSCVLRFDFCLLQAMKYPLYLFFQIQVQLASQSRLPESSSTSVSIPTRAIRQSLPVNQRQKMQRFTFASHKNDLLFYVSQFW